MSTPLSAALFTPLDDLDPATPGDPFVRLHYHYGQLLGAEDFTTEQRYFLLRSRLHNAAPHGLGTVWGLRIRHEETTDPAGLRLICEPGLAIDALGREIHVPRAVCLDVGGLASTRFWTELAPPPGAEAGERRRRVYAVLRYRACLSEMAPAIVPPCSDQDAALAPSRVVDGYRLCLEAAPPADPAATQRDITAIATPADPRGRLLAHILTPPVDLARFWSGADEAPLLLATLDLEPVGDPVERVKLAGGIDNAVRALLPAVQALADLALGIRLDGAPTPPAFQAVGVAAVAGSGADAGKTLVSVATSAAVKPASLTNSPPRLLRFDDGDGKWRTVAVSQCVATATGMTLTADEAWTSPTAFQVCLAGTGERAILDTGGRPLAGVVGEAVPAGAGRDACLFATFTPAV
ncbi:MAG TPA: hypothetical protein PLS67_02165 [Accumulibacter sp.]|nr:hypothetical protein [Accumulibacter sp.]